MIGGFFQTNEATNFHDIGIMASYFGEKVALYFAYYAFYMAWLAFATIPIVPYLIYFAYSFATFDKVAYNATAHNATALATDEHGCALPTPVQHYDHSQISYARGMGVAGRGPRRQTDTRERARSRWADKASTRHP